VSIEATSVADAARAPSPETPRTWWTGRRVIQVAAALIGLQLIVRGSVAATGHLWQDDLVVTGRAGRIPLFSSEFLLYNHDGHFMPAGFLLTGLFTKLAPLEWWPMLVALVLMQLLASLAVLRMLRLLLGNRPVLLVPLMLYLFSPLTLPAFAWWIAAVNAIPLQAGMAWVVGDAIKLLRTGRVRYAVSGTLVFALTLSFFEKSLVVPVVAFAVIALLRRFEGDTAPILSAARRDAKLWIGLVLVVGVWAAVYASVVGSPAIAAEAAGTVPQATRLLVGGFFRGLLPGIFGGPLTWADPGLWALPPRTLVLGSWITAALAVVWTCWRRRGFGVVWWLVGAYLAVNGAAMVMGRLNFMTPDILSLSLRYFADSTVVIALAIAFIPLAPAREDRPARKVLTDSERRLVVAGAAVAFVLASVWSTVTFCQQWTRSPIPEYLATAKATLAESTDVPLLEQAVPDVIVWALAHPNNLASQVFSPLPERPQFGNSTTELRIIDESGEMTGGRVEPLRWVTEGPLADCGHGVSGRRTTVVPLDGPLMPWSWTVQLNYLAGGDGVLEVALDGETVRTPVTEGANTVYIRIAGGGDKIRLTSATPGLAVCLDSGIVGNMEPIGAP
jgi:hypothetical protein